MSHGNCKCPEEKKPKITKEEYEQIKVVQSNNMKGNKNINFGGKSFTKETIEHFREIRKGINIGENNPFYSKKHTEETKQKISESKKGIKWTQERHEQRKNNYKKENHPNWGKHLSEETREKIRKGNIGKGHDKEWCEQHSKALKGRIKKPIKCIETGEIFPNATTAAKIRHQDRAPITKCCKGEIENVKGQHWKYIDLEEYEDFIRNEENGNKL